MDDHGQEQFYLDRSSSSFYCRPVPSEEETLITDSSRAIFRPAERSDERGECDVDAVAREQGSFHPSFPPRVSRANPVVDGIRDSAAVASSPCYWNYGGDCEEEEEDDEDMGYLQQQQQVMRGGGEYPYRENFRGNDDQQQQPHPVSPYGWDSSEEDVAGNDDCAFHHDSHGQEEEMEQQRLRKQHIDYSAFFGAPSLAEASTCQSRSIDDRQQQKGGGAIVELLRSTSTSASAWAPPQPRAVPAANDQQQHEAHHRHYQHQYQPHATVKQAFEVQREGRDVVAVLPPNYSYEEEEDGGDEEASSSWLDRPNHQREEEEGTATFARTVSFGSSGGGPVARDLSCPSGETLASSLSSSLGASE